MNDKVLMKGNEAIAESAILSGCLYYFGYPITPQTEISEYMAKRMPQVGGLCLQAESEIAAINMVLGATSGGSRAMTSSSSPGISLKSEGISYIAASDLPCLIVNVQRGGPGLGGIQPSQQDYYQATRGVGHGDLRLIVLAPSSVQEMAEYTSLSFELGDKYRMPVMILADGALGQMMEPVDFSKIKFYPSVPKPWATNGTKMVRKKNIINSLYLNPNELENSIIERYKRYDKVVENETRYETYMTDDAEIILVSFGIMSRVSKTAIDKLRAKGIKAGLFRPITLWPFPSKEISKIANNNIKFLSVEMSMGQMVDDVKIAVNGKSEVFFFGRTGGIIPTSNEIISKVESIIK